MAPDLNSLPPSRSISSSPLQARNIQSSPNQSNMQDIASPRTGTSLAAAATINAADRSRRSSSSYQNRGSPLFDRIASDRRRSQVAMNLNLNDPTIPSPGELTSSDQRSSIGHSFSAASPLSLGGRGTIATGDPHHQRQPSLGDIHNELEQEQEAQVNRMLQMIRAQQQQLDNLQRSAPEGEVRQTSSTTATTTNTAIVDEPTPGSERSFSFQRSNGLSRNPSSANRSPALRPLPSQETHGSGSEAWPPSPLDRARRNSTRDESAFYQAETANLTRENQMLKLRIRELEKQVSETKHRDPNSPSTPSNLATSPPLEPQPDGATSTSELHV